MFQKTTISLLRLRVALAVLSAMVLCSVSCGSMGQNKGSQKGFVKIFDGKSLKGWKGDTTYWRAENGSLVGEITPSTLLKTNSFIIWQGGRAANFEIIFDFKITKAGNSGLNYRSEQLTDVAHALRGYQADIDGTNRYTGQNYEERARTTLAYRGEIVTVNPPENTTAPLRDNVKSNAWLLRTVTGSLGKSEDLQTKINSEDWNTCRVVANGNHLQHYINGILMSDVTDNDPVNGKKDGLLGVQVHVGPPMKVEYKNIYLKTL